jgi:hypothetical protein
MGQVAAQRVHACAVDVLLTAMGHQSKACQHAGVCCCKIHLINSISTLNLSNNDNSCPHLGYATAHLPCPDDPNNLGEMPVQHTGHPAASSNNLKAKKHEAPTGGQSGVVADVLLAHDSSWTMHTAGAAERSAQCHSCSTITPRLI